MAVGIGYRTLEKEDIITILNRFGEVDRVPVRTEDLVGMPFRYCLMVQITGSKQEWFAMSGKTSSEAINNLYNCFSNRLWKHCVEEEQHK